MASRDASAVYRVELVLLQGQWSFWKQFRNKITVTDTSYNLRPLYICDLKPMAELIYMRDTAAENPNHSTAGLFYSMAGWSHLTLFLAFRRVPYHI